MRHLLRVDDLRTDEIDAIKSRAEALRAGSDPIDRDGRRLVGLVFLNPSLRTRVGFAAAGQRLGWGVVHVDEVRTAPTAESIGDTLRTVAGYVDVVVARLGAPFGDHVSDSFPALVVNGGDGGPSPEHPTQALIDLFAIEQLVGPVSSCRVAMVGDLRMRAARSLLRMLSRRPPRELHLCAPTPFDQVDPPSSLGDARRWTRLVDVPPVDVLYAVGMPHESIDLARREELRVTRSVIERLPPHSRVLSPLPVLDEISADCAGDDRLGYFAQSDLGLFVRMAVLEWASDVGGGFRRR